MGKTCSAANSCRDLDTGDGLPILNGTAVVNANCSIQLGVRVYSEWTRNANMTATISPASKVHSHRARRRVVHA